MYHFLSTLTPEQWALVAGLVSPLVQFGLGKLKDLSSTHNWLLSFALPILGTVAAALASSPQFTELVPMYAVVYTSAQGFYFVAVKWWKKYLELTKPVETESF
jgi:hypothetical protein